MMTAATRWRRVPQRRAASRREATDDRQVLVGLDRGHEYVLNATALALWELCDGDTSAEEMAEGVCELFAIPRHQAVADVRRTLAEFERVGLIDWRDDAERVR